MFEVDIASNPHLNQEALKLLSEDLSPEEKEVREKGIFLPKGGPILKEFNLSRHVIKGGGPIPSSWAIYMSLDHGFNNPTAALWHAVSPQGKVVTFKEHYRSKMVIRDHAKRIKEINKEIGREPLMYVCDPSMSQKTAETGTSPLQLYRENGIPLVQAKKDVDGRINKMNEYLQYDLWHITEECPNAIREIRGYSFMIFNSPKIADRNNKREQPKKKNDHCPDSCGYFFNFMPYLTPEIKNLAKGMSQTLTNREDFPWEIDSSFMTGNPDDYAFGEV
jgi:phage terminase large subunit